MFKVYMKTVRLPQKKLHMQLETMMERVKGMERWAVDISCY